MNLIKKIFEQLDNDHDGYISSKAIDIQDIDVDVLEMISPVLFNMEEKGTILSLTEFVK